MTARRRTAVAIALVAALAVSVWRAARPPAPSPLREENFGLVAKGMTLAEVEHLLGVPPGDYGDGEHFWIVISHSKEPPGLATECWTGRSRQLDVWFDADGRVYWAAVNGLIYLPRENIFRRYWRVLVGPPRATVAAS